MANYNKLILVGRITRDIEVRRTADDKAVVKFGLAVNRKWGDKEEVMFIDVTMFGKRGEALAKFNKKGSCVLVDGRLNQETWEDKNGGGKKSKHAMIADEWQFMDAKQEGGPASRQDAAGTALDYGNDEPF